MSDHHAHHEHHESGHSRGHGNDQGLNGALRYLRSAPRMWRSDINNAVVDMVDPQPNERIVDIGAGMGAGTVVAARSGASVIAVEPTPFLRRVLRVRRILQRNRVNISVVDGAAEQLPSADSGVDAIWAVNTMHHWLDPERGAAEISRALRPGGRVLLVDEDFTDPTHPKFEQFGGDHEEEGHHHGFSMVDADRMGALLTSAGLVQVDAGRRSIAGRPSIVISGYAPSTS